MMKSTRASLLFALLFSSSLALASGGYDNGTPAGKGNLDLDLTLNPMDKVENGQSYLVWGYGLTDRLDFHGYASHEAAGTNQIYYGLMYNVYRDERLDLSTAIGARHRLQTVDAFFPQLLYTLRLPENFDLIGSVTNVHNYQENFNRGIACDIALRIPLPQAMTPDSVKDIKMAVGLFKSVSKDWSLTTRNWYPTYSLDFRF